MGMRETDLTAASDSSKKGWGWGWGTRIKLGSMLFVILKYLRRKNADFDSNYIYLGICSITRYNIGLLIKCLFFAEYWRKWRKIVTITLTPDPLLNRKCNWRNSRIFLFCNLSWTSIQCWDSILNTLFFVGSAKITNTPLLTNEF
jgi:hypothetical protein